MGAATGEGAAFDPRRLVDYSSPPGARPAADMAKLVDARDLKSLGLWPCGFDPRRPHHSLTAGEETQIMGLEVWEYALIAAGAIWGAWLFRKKKK